jgi:hypothetical protein
MDEGGIDLQVLSLGGPGVQALSPARSVEVSAHAPRASPA